MKRFLLYLTLAVLVNQFFWQATIPYNRAPDEFSHFWVSRFIYQNGKLPVYGVDPPQGILKEEGMSTPSFSGMPPLAYLVQAGAMKLVDFGNDSLYLGARVGQMVFTPFLIMGAWYFSKVIFKDEKKQKLFLVTTGFWPSLTFLSAYINSDWATVCLTSLFWGLAFFYAKKPPNWKQVVVLGLSLAAASLTRYNGFFTLLTAGAWLSYWWLKKGYWNYWLGLASVASLFSGWWYLHNLAWYNDLFLVKPFYKVIRLIRPEEVRGYSFLQMFQNQWFKTSAKSLFFSFDWNNHFWPKWGYAVVGGLFFWGVFQAWQKKVFKKGWHCFSLTAFLGSFLQTFWHSWKLSFQPQARHFLPSFLGFLALGLSGAGLGFLSLFSGLVYLSNLLSLGLKIVPRYYSYTRSGGGMVMDYFNQIAFLKPMIYQKPVVMGLVLVFLALSFLIFKDIRTR